MASCFEVIDDMVAAWNDAGRPTRRSWLTAARVRSGIVYDEAVRGRKSPSWWHQPAVHEGPRPQYGGDVEAGPVQLRRHGAVGGAAGADFPGRAHRAIRSLGTSTCATMRPVRVRRFAGPPVVDPRFSYVRKGAAPVWSSTWASRITRTTTQLGGRPRYGYDLASMLMRMGSHSHEAVVRRCTSGNPALCVGSGVQALRERQSAACVVVHAEWRDTPEFPGGTSVDGRRYMRRIATKSLALDAACGSIPAFSAPGDLRCHFLVTTGATRRAVRKHALRLVLKRNSSLCG